MSNVTIKGTGWINTNSMGALIKKEEFTFDKIKDSFRLLLEKNITNIKIKNFGRFDKSSKMIVSAIALALHDADLKDEIKDMSILRMNETGSNDSNLKYFKDYIESGRTLARGNLFIYTLPTSPLAEAAVIFGIKGNIVYSSTPLEDFQENVNYALNMLKPGKKTKYNAIVIDCQNSACCIILENN